MTCNCAESGVSDYVKVFTVGLAIIILNVCIELFLVFKAVTNLEPGTPWTIYVVTFGAVAGGIAAVYHDMIRGESPVVLNVKDAFQLWVRSGFFLLLSTYITGVLLGLLFIGIPTWISDSVSSAQSCKYDENCY